MKNISKCLAVGSAITGCLFAGVKLVKSVKRCRNDANSYEEELAKIRLKHDAAMEALEKEEANSKREREKRMDDIRKRLMEKWQK